MITGNSVSRAQGLMCMKIMIKRLVRRDKDGRQDLVRIRNALPRIFGQIQLRRTIASEIRDSTGQVYRVGDKIPPYWINAVELQQSLEEKREYQQHHRTLVAGLAEKLKVSASKQRDAGGVQDTVDKNVLNTTHYRRISLLASSVLLEHFAHLSIANKAADVKRWHAKERDFRWVVNKIKFSHESELKTVSDYLRFMAFGSPKLRYPCAMVKDIVIDRKEKILIFVEWPLTQWFLEMFFGAMVFKVKSLHAGLKESERAALAKSFREDNDIQILKEVETICQREGFDLNDPKTITLAIDIIHQRLNGQAVRRLDSDVVGMDIDYSAIEEPYIV
ncbi:MAG: hypothetical protein M1840_002283 [Geoglossum simile]|nr:MAG: hypothetical protein M1840_002283 [Geoglossum simile]